MFPITIQLFARSPPPAAAGSNGAHPHRPPLRPSSVASSAARFCPPTSAVPPGHSHHGRDWTHWTIIKHRWGLFFFLGDGELFFEPKFCVIQVKLVISNGETDGRTRALKRLCIYPICSSPSYLAILLYYDSMCLKWNPPTPLWRWRRAYWGATATLNAQWHLLI